MGQRRLQATQNSWNQKSDLDVIQVFTYFGYWPDQWYIEVKGNIVTGFKPRSRRLSAPQGGKCKIQARKPCTDSLILAKHPFIFLFQNNALAALLQERCIPSRSLAVHSWDCGYEKDFFYFMFSCLKQKLSLQLVPVSNCGRNNNPGKKNAYRVSEGCGQWDNLLCQPQKIGVFLRQLLT